MKRYVYSPVDIDELCFLNMIPTKQYPTPRLERIMDSINVSTFDELNKVPLSQLMESEYFGPRALKDLEEWRMKMGVE